MVDADERVEEEEWSGDDDSDDDSNFTDHLTDEDMYQPLDEREALMLRVERNDPYLSEIILYGDCPPRHGWEVFGASIGRNTHLKVLSIQIEVEPFLQLGWRFFRGLALNRSIKKLEFFCNLRCGQMLLYLVPFFMNNKAFETLKITYLNTDVENFGRLDTLEYALDQFDGLKELTLVSDAILDNGVDKVIKALSGHAGLRKITLLVVRISLEGFIELATLLRNPSSNLTTLSLHLIGQLHVDNQIACALSTGLNGNSTLRVLNISLDHEFTALGWQSIFAQLKNATCRVEKLVLDSNDFSSTSIHSLTDALDHGNSSIKALKLYRCTDNNFAIVQAIIQLLRSPYCMLESLALSRNDFDDGKMESLTAALANNSCLKELDLTANRGVTPAGWQSLIWLLQRPSCRLEKLELNFLTDETVESLSGVLSSNNSRLKELGLNQCMGVTPAGWRSLVAVLLLPNITLRRLGLCCNRIDNQLMLSFADVLANNHTLTELSIGWADLRGRPVLTHGNPAAFTHILYDTSSILNTYNSNHTVEKLWHDVVNWSTCDLSDLSYLLRVNRESSKSQAARIKIIRAHFSGSNINTQVFTDMELNALPIAIAWMGQGGKGGQDVLFSFLRSMPSVCNAKRKSNKRKALDVRLG